MYYNSRKKTKKLKWQGIVSAVVFAILGIVTLFSFSSSFSNIMLGIFGIMFYPMIIFAVLISLGFALNMKFSLSGKNLAYLIVSIISLELLLHTAFVAKYASSHGVRFSHYFDFLGKVATFASGLTVGGLIASLIAYPFMCLLSPVGACIFFAIILTVFVALSADYYLFVKNTEANQKVKSMLQRNGAEEYNYSYLGDSIGGAVSNASMNGDVKVKQSRENFSSVSANQTDDGIIQQETPYIFDDYSDEQSTAEQGTEDYELFNDDKANSHYDPEKFTSAEEYIKYPYVPPIFKNNKSNDVYNTQEEEEQTNFEEEDETPNYMVDYGEGNEYINDDEDVTTETFADEYVNGEDEEVSPTVFTEGLDSSRFMNTRARRGDSAFDNNPIS